jgi:EAL domain-containing protein (putative c-di-GMP-specific phosphodiesterase class I)
LGRNRYAFHNGTQPSESFEIIRGSEDIFAGIDNKQFIPVYQPQFRASDRSLIGLEALARWRHPIRGILTPETFMPAAKLLKFEAEIDQQILDHTLADIQKWNTLGLKIPRIAVNISPRRLCDDNLIKSLQAMNIPHGVLSFELLESIFVGEDDAQLIENVEQIKALGIDIEIDDFGTGFASIVSLIRLQPNRLKIDRSLVSPVLENPANRQVLRSIVEMARALNIEVLAEGVENELQARVLRTIGCDSLQGFGLAKPMQLAQMTRYLTELEQTN